MLTNIIGYNEYVTSEGDTFDILALREYGEEQLSSVIIQENIQYADVLVFEQGTLLYIPVLETIDTPDTLPPWRRGESGDDM